MQINVHYTFVLFSKLVDFAPVNDKLGYFSSINCQIDRIKNVPPPLEIFV